MITVMPNIYGDDSITVKVIELGDIEGLGQPGVVCVTEECNLSSMKTSLLYRECVIVELWKYETLLRTLEQYQKQEDEQRKTLELIASFGGKEQEGLSCNGSWCAEQARTTLERRKP